jgi:hypothetical protein
VPHITICTAIAEALALLFAIAGTVLVTGPGFVQRAYARWEMPPKFHRVTGILDLMTALFLANAETRIWGVVLGAMISFYAVVTLLKSEQYGWSVPGMLMLAALVPASLAGPLQ